MKQHTSVLRLMLRASILIVLLIAVLQSCLTLFTFFHRAQNRLDWRLPWLMDDSRLQFYFVLFIVSAARILSITGSHLESNPGYTLCRLSISEKAIFCWQTLANFLLYLLLFTIQALVLLLCAALFLRIAVPEQLVDLPALPYAAARTSSFFRALMPGTDWLMWLSLLMLLAVLAASTAFTTFMDRRGHKFPMYVPAVLLLYFYITHKTPTIGSNVVLILSALMFLVCLLYQVWENGDEPYEGEAQSESAS